MSILRSVKGFVHNTEGETAEGVNIALFAIHIKDGVITERKIGNSVESNASGEFYIEYTLSELEIQAGNVHVQVKAFDNTGQLLGSLSDVQYNVPEHLEGLQLNVKALPKPIAFDFQLLTSKIKKESGTDSLNNLKADDQPTIHHLSRALKEDPIVIQQVIKAHHLEANEGVSAPIAFALLKNSDTIELNALKDTTRNGLRATIRAASDRQLIKPISDFNIKKNIDALIAKRTKDLINLPEGRKTMEVGDTILLAVADKATQEKIANVFVSVGGNSPDRWDALKKAKIDAATISKIQLIENISQPLQNYLPLVRHILADKKVKKAKDLVKYNLKDWQKIAVSDVVNLGDFLPGDNLDKEGKAKIVATVLSNNIEGRFPAAAIHWKIVDDAPDALRGVHIPDSNPIKAFLTSNPDFEFGFQQPPYELLKKYSRTNKLDPEQSGALFSGLRTINRLYQLAPRYDQVKAFVKEGVSGSADIARMGEAKFVEKFNPILNGLAQVVYEVAKDKFIATIELMVTYGMPRTELTVLQNSIGTTSYDDDPAQIADWRQLFGTLDMCSCTHCQSVLSPAAYYVDILEFLEKQGSVEDMTPLDLLLQRRPDLEHIELTCQNTNTELPIIDLANEILENAISGNTDIVRIGLVDLTQPNDLSPKTETKNGVRTDSTFVMRGALKMATVRKWWQTTLKKDELLALPQHTNYEAYEKLAKAWYPWSLPFSLPKEAVNNYLSRLNIRRSDMVAYFQPQTPNKALYEALVYLGLSEQEWHLIKSDAQKPKTYELWGFKGAELNAVDNFVPDPSDTAQIVSLGTWNKALRRLDIFLQQSGLSYVEALNLIQTQFISPYGDLYGLRFELPGECDLSKRFLTKGNEDLFRRVYQFVKLSKGLSIDFFQLDHAIRVLSDGKNISQPFIISLCHAQQLSESLDINLSEVLSWFGDLDKVAYNDFTREPALHIPSAYDTIFRNRSLFSLQEINEVFPENPDELKNITFEKQKTQLLSIFSINENDLNFLFKRLQYDINDPSSLAKLSRVFRHISLSRALDMTIEELLLAIDLWGSPFEDSKMTLAFCQWVHRIQSAGLKVYEVRYIVSGVGHALLDKSIVQPEVVTQALSTIRLELRKIHEMIYRDVEPDDNLRFCLESLGWTSSQIAQLMLAISSKEETVKSAKLLKYIYPENAAYPSGLSKKQEPPVLIPDLDFKKFSGLTKPQKVKSLLDKLRPFITNKLGEDYLKHHFSQLLGISEDDLSGVSLRADKGKGIGNVLLHSKNFIEKGELKQATQYYQQWLRVLWLKNKLNLPAKLLPWQFGKLERFRQQKKKIFPLFDWNDLAPNNQPRGTKATLEAFDQLLMLLALKKRLQLEDKEVATLLSTLEDRKKEHVFENTLLEYTGWNESYWADLTSSARYPEDFRDVKKLTRWADMFDVLNKTGLSPADCRQLSTADLKEETVLIAQSALKQRYKPKQWLEVAHEIHNPLRSKKRDALVAYLLAHPDLTGNRLMKDAMQLSEYFLIDVEMEPQMLTSRIKQGISTVQMFVQRCLLNLEYVRPAGLPPGSRMISGQIRNEQRIGVAGIVVMVKGSNIRTVTDGAGHFKITVNHEHKSLVFSGAKLTGNSEYILDTTNEINGVIKNRKTRFTKAAPVVINTQYANQWNRWRKYYRVWEANRKVFLYPENWIEPELRDDKSPFFKELEGELLQDNLNSANSWRVFKNYLERYRSIATLEKLGQTNVVNNMRYSFFWTIHEPSTYYFRQELVDTSTNVILHAFPWEPINLSIQNRQLIPVIWNHELYIFWPTFLAKSDQVLDSSNTVNAAAKYIEIKLNYSVLANDKWSVKKTSNNILKFREKITDDTFDWFVFDGSPNSTPDMLKISCGVKDAQISITSPAHKQFLGYLVVPSYSWSPFLLINPIGDELKNIINMDIIRGESHWIDPYPENWGMFAHLENPQQYYADFDLNRIQNIKISGNSDEILSNQLKIGGYFFLKDPGEISTRSLKIKYYTLHFPAKFTQNAGEWGNATFLTYKEYLPYNNQQKYNDTPGDDINALFSFLPEQNASYGGFLFLPLLIRLDSVPESKKYTFRLNNKIDISFDQVINEFLQYIIDGICYKSDNVMLHKGIGITKGNAPSIFINMVTFKEIFLKKAFQELNTIQFIVIDIEKKDKPPQANGYIIGTKKIGDFEINSSDRIIHATQFSGSSSALGFMPYPKNDLIKNEKFYPLQQFINQNPITAIPLLPIQKENTFYFEQNYALYNWEIMFHIPLQIANQLSREQRFEEAQRWFHFIFDPSLSNGGGTERFWKFYPFYHLETKGGIKTLSELVEEISLDKNLMSELNGWAEKPFNPHAIGRSRVTPYMKSVVMKYLDNLIDWADNLFRRDTLESINEAIQLYILAFHILGRKPGRIPPMLSASSKVYEEIKTGIGLDDFRFSTAAEDVLLPYARLTPTKESHLLETLPLFCLPINEKLMEYWAKIEDRLFKIHHSLNIEGIERQLPLFEPPIDPALLVRAAAAGLDISSVLDDLSAPAPVYRFMTLLQKAKELTNEVKSLGSTLLSVLEKKDTEALALLRAGHEHDLLKMTRKVKEDQVREIDKTLEQLDKNMEVVQHRIDFYAARANISRLNAENPLTLNEREKLSLAKGKEATANQIEAGEIEYHAAMWHWVPDISFGVSWPVPPPAVLSFSLGTSYGGSKIASGKQAEARKKNNETAKLNNEASEASTMGSHQRRMDDWNLQYGLAIRELEQLKKQRLGTEIRKAIAEKELENHEQQIENAHVMLDAMREKYTNAQLYQWMKGQIANIYFQTYRMAFDMAKRAEKAMLWELGTNTPYINYGYWDNLHQGLLAGEKLAMDIHRLEIAYLDRNKRELELTKHISLNQLNPLALLQLRELGKCDFFIPEELFDLDFPGHYMRRIKSVSITIPCVAGPYTSINATLRLKKNSTRVKAFTNAEYVRKLDSDDDRFSDQLTGIQSIATSSGQNDSGLFELNFRDERYLPFEGAGAISEWTLEMMEAKELRQFDYNNISDIIMHVRYTAREDGGLKLKAVAHLKSLTNALGTVPLQRLFSLRHDFPNEWHAWTKQNQPLSVKLEKHHFPYFAQMGNLALVDLKSYKKGDTVAEINSTFTLADWKITRTAPTPEEQLADDYFLIIQYTI